MCYLRIACPVTRCQKLVSNIVATITLLDIKRLLQVNRYNCYTSHFSIRDIFQHFTTHCLLLADKPICRPDQKRVYGVARHENAHVMCEVEAYPPPDSFKWSFNNTAETIDVPQARYKTSAAPSGSSTSQSMLTYTPMTEMDYGTVMCWASNMAGQQKEPCVFHIIAAGSSFSAINKHLIVYTRLDKFYGNLCSMFFVVVCLFSWRYNLLWLYFHSPVAGFSLLVFDIS